MERGHSGAEQDSVRKDINCVVRQLMTWLLCHCLLTDLYQVISDWKSYATAAMGPTNMTVNVA